ncbi:STAS domain-containing protein [Micromonospora sp. AMSO12t]|uniref:STAS domain-containing protein n=1 Tax=Micromonospora sp. AMSO12t TaxID=2650410 RepID=UPI00124BAD21|nr:STAS domain-containing protein [Micromonospora sp. AMSO12t]KAB1146145.1 STAS domain-containing protein [Micromonospora sp. AMSO12t]
MDRGERNTEPGQVVLRPAGEIDMATAGEFEATLTEALRRPGVREVVVDLADLRFLDSSGVRVLVHGVSVGRERDVTMRVTGPQPGVARVLRITGVGTLLGLVDSDADESVARGWRGLD